MAIEWYYGLQELILSSHVFGTEGQLFMILIAFAFGALATEVKDMLLIITIILGVLTMLGVFVWLWAFILIAILTVIYNIKG